MTKKWSALALIIFFTPFLNSAHAQEAGIHEEGSLSLRADQPQSFSTDSVALRVISFGNTTIGLKINGSTHPHLIVEGPLADFGDTSQPGSGPVAQDFPDSPSAKVTLPAAGLYRLVFQGAPGEKISVVSSCLDPAGCQRPEISNQELLTILRDHKELDVFLNVAEKKIDQFVDSPGLRRILLWQLGKFIKLVRPGIHDLYDKFLQSRTFESAQHFPILNIKYLPMLRPLTELHSSTPKADEVIKGDLVNLVNHQNAIREFPKTVPGMPDLQGGSFPNLTLTKEQVAQSRGLARILTSLAVNNGSYVTWEGHTFTKPDELVQALIASGHSVTVTNERTYAAFIDFSTHGKYVRWPVWLETDTKLPDGKKLVIPMGHSQFAWRIEGPVINAKVMFFLGEDGSAFFPVDQTRPPWTGLRPVYTLSTSHGDTHEIIRTLQVAAQYLRRNRIERITVAKGMAADGYGYVGVCNDSTAVIEYLTHGTISAFPLARASKLDKAPRLNDGLDDVVRKLPHDMDNPPTATELFKRVYESIPFPAPQNLVIADPSLAGKMVEPDLGQEMELVGHALGLQ